MCSNIIIVSRKHCLLVPNRRWLNAYQLNSYFDMEQCTKQLRVNNCLMLEFIEFKLDPEYKLVDLS